MSRTYQQMTAVLGRVTAHIKKDRAADALEMLTHDAELTRFANQNNLLLAVAATNQVNVAAHLVENGANIHACDEYGNTALHKAAWHGQVKMAKHFLLNGARVNAVSNNWYTPLHNAAFRGHMAMAQLLLYHGASQTVRAKVTHHLPKDEAEPGSHLHAYLKSRYAAHMNKMHGADAPKPSL